MTDSSEKQGPVFTENWYSDAQLHLLSKAANLAATSHDSGLFVEVGAWEGKSTLAIVHSIYPHNLHVIDHWQGDGDNPNKDGIDPAILANRDVYARFLGNLQAGGARNVVIHRKRWQEYVTQERPLGIAFAHIDGAHDYTSVFYNLQAFIEVAASNAVFCGDDALHPEVRAAVLDAFSGVGEPPIIGFAGCPQFWLKQMPMKGN